MDRKQITTLFPDATEEQVTSILNAHHAELQAEKKNAEEWKNKAGQAQTLEEQLAEAERLKAEAEQQREAAENKNLSEVDLLKKELEKNQTASNKQIAELQAQLATSEINAYASSKNLVGEQISNILKAFGGNVEVAKTAIDNFVSYVEEREQAAVSAYEQKLQSETGVPGGNKGTSPENDATKQAVLAAAKRANTANTDILNHYIRR